ncbi:histidine triad (HIT) protein [Haladaptatus paucihalophilus DX253]|uniref:ATP adenylyltransferase n=1 Tax=Haladaptatus paucihalophilus DX253 TaxID=797209 RepID=E7R002_HALPU|nr:HIT domain-containing protein [Haladaptatus paucihalophilus]EFW89896.1 histidine triad (HIT) protein [Haladaptatus paucihalophilus DX253]SHK57447.1 ATP adenylyltransferase [Haladaptatus paucihalophilus DX253]
MQQVFAPWRMEWVERDTDEEFEGCVFCAFPKRDDDREHLVVARNDHAVVMLNNYPYNPGHVMVIPNEHERDYAALGEETLLGHARMKQRTFDAMEAAFSPDGFNAGLNIGEGSGGSIDHLHTHVVPRWTGDTNFMPVISDTKVIVEGLDDTYDKLHAAFAEQDGATVPDADSAVSFVD